MIIRIVRGRIEEQACDAIVNPGNRDLDGNGGAEGCIARAAGTTYREACSRQHPLEVAETRWTTAGSLPCKIVIHTVAPNALDSCWRGKLVMCWRNIIRLALDLDAIGDCKTIAIPALGTGAYRLPRREACALAVHALATLAEEGLGKDLEVILVAYDDEIEHWYRVALFGLPRPGCNSSACPVAHSCVQFYPLFSKLNRWNFGKEGCWLYSPAQVRF